MFASFGLFMGYLLPSENVMQVIGPVLAVFSLFGGLFMPVSLLPSVMQDIAPFMPTYGVAAIARFPLRGRRVRPDLARERGRSGRRRSPSRRCSSSGATPVAPDGMTASTVAGRR